MKKYITVAALLAAGSALANAATVLTTTFSNANQATATSVALSNAGLSVTSASVSSLVSGTSAAEGSTLSLKTTGGAGTNASFFSPDNNVGSGNPWTVTFSYDFGTESISVANVDLGVNLYNGNGDWQSDKMNNGNLSEGVNYRGFSFTLSFIGADGSSTLGTLSNARVALTGNGGSAPQTVTLSGTGSEISLSGQVDVVLTVQQSSDNGNVGCYLGLNSIAYNDASGIPEPSAFGLLAGLGALALVASRRRRK